MFVKYCIIIVITFHLHQPFVNSKQCLNRTDELFSPPKINKKHVSPEIHATAGLPVTIACKATGNPCPSITWFKNGSQLSPDDGIVKFRPKKYAIEINQPLHQDEGNYTCIVTNEAGSDSYTTKLVVTVAQIHKPIIHNDEISQRKAHVGESLTLTCNVETNSEWITYWYKISDDGKWEEIETPEGDTSSLRLNNVTIQDSGMYRCHILNSYGEGEKKFNVTIMETKPPKIRRCYALYLPVIVGSNVTLKCEFKGTAVEQYWLMGNFTEPLNETNILKKGDSSLDLENVTLDAEGWYSYVVRNKFGLDSSNLLLTVDREPTTIHAAKTSEIDQLHFFISAAFIITIGLIMMICLAMCLCKAKSSRRTLKEGETVIIKKKITLEEPTDCNDSLKAPLVKIDCPLGDSYIPVEKYMRAVVEYDMPLDYKWEINRKRLSLIKPVGQGNFGTVYKGELRGVGKNKDVVTTVAVKMLKDLSNDSDMSDLVSEMEVMKRIGKHENIINLIGCCTQNGPLYVIVEYATNGNLRDFLRSHSQESSDFDSSKALFPQDFISFALQIAQGMEYLASKRCVHRDLAARNILVTENNIMKIADFGLARNLKSVDYYRKTTKGVIPLRWMAPEAIDQVYSSASDVWSYGVLLWEIWTLGCLPYKETDQSNLYNYLKEGHRLRQPAGCPNNVYKLMRSCWRYRPWERPTFSEIVHSIRQFDKMDEIYWNDAHYIDMAISSMDTPATSDYEVDYSDSVDAEESSLHGYQNVNNHMNTQLNRLYFINESIV